jgi:hypothetical protein
LRGFEKSPITDVVLERCTFDGVQRPDVLEHVRGLVCREVKVNGAPRA